MNILVTGAKGFVGRNLISQLHNIQSGKAKNYVISGEELKSLNMILIVILPSWISIAKMPTLCLTLQE